MAVTDISVWALSSLPIWEHVFQVRIDHVFCSTSYANAVKDSSVECVFAFGSAHHFCAQRETLQDVYRVLKPGGHCFYFYEPSCPRFWYRLATWRVNRKRPEVPEDVLVPSGIQEIATEVGFECQVLYNANLYKRGPLETVYYAVLQLAPKLQPLLPCTATYHFIKKPH